MSGGASFDFTGSVVAVTGAATGIGRAVAAAFGAAGADVWLADIDEGLGTEAASSLPGGRFHRCDVTSETDVDELLSAIDQRHGTLDVLVNNAGGFWEQRTTEQLSTEEWQRVIDLNLTGVFLVSRRAVPLLRTSAGGGRVINIGSLAGQTAGYTTSPAYAAAKAGVHSLTRVMAHELAAAGITVNALAPSAVMTERIAAVRGPEEREATARSIPLGRYQEPDELAGWVLFLASAGSGFTTGQTVGVNGGRFMA